MKTVDMETLYHKLEEVQASLDKTYAVMVLRSVSLLDGGGKTNDTTLKNECLTFLHDEARKVLWGEAG